MPNSRQLRILHVVSPARVGGLERVVHALAAGHHRRGHDVSVAALIGSGDDGETFVSPLENVGVDVHRCPVRPFSIASERRFVRDLCRRKQPQVVHSHGYRPDIVDAGVARGLGIPTITTEHGMSRMGGRTAVYEWLQMRCLRQFEAVVAVSRPIATALEQSGVRRERIHLVPNAWPNQVVFHDRHTARQKLNLSMEPFVVGWVGRLIVAKGADVLVRAIAELSDLSLRVALVGDGPERVALEGLARSLGLADRIRFYGEVIDIAPCFRAFDVFVLSSRTEGTPIVLFEAMAAEVPSIAASVGGVPDVLREDAALLVRPDDPVGLARALRESIREPAEGRARAVRAALRLREHYSLEPWLERYEVLYRRISHPSTPTSARTRA